MASIDPNSLMAVLAGSGVYVSMLPHLAEVRRASVDSATARDVRMGVGMASAALIGAGAILAAAERDATPLLLTVAIAALMGGIYEFTLRSGAELEAPRTVDYRGRQA